MFVIFVKSYVTPWSQELPKFTTHLGACHRSPCDTEGSVPAGAAQCRTCHQSWFSLEAWLCSTQHIQSRRPGLWSFTLPHMRESLSLYCECQVPDSSDSWSSWNFFLAILCKPSSNLVKAQPNSCKSPGIRSKCAVCDTRVYSGCPDVHKCHLLYNLWQPVIRRVFMCATNFASICRQTSFKSV